MEEAMIYICDICVERGEIRAVQGACSSFLIRPVYLFRPVSPLGSYVSLNGPCKDSPRTRIEYVNDGRLFGDWPSVTCGCSAIGSRLHESTSTLLGTRSIPFSFVSRHHWGQK